MDTATLVANARSAASAFSLDKLDLNVHQIKISGLTGADAAPIALTNLRLRNLEPFAFGGPDAEIRKPNRFQIDGGLDPLASQFTVTLETALFAPEPTLKADLTATGIKGDCVTQLFPALHATIDGSKLTDGTFHTHLDATIDYGRRGPRDFDLARGFNVAFDVKPVEFRATPDGPVIAGLDEIRGDEIKVTPANGNVDLKAIEITKPIARITRETDGIHAFGLVIPLALSSDAPQSGPTTQASSVTAASPPPASPPLSPLAPAPPTPLVRPSSEIRLDLLTVSGVDVVLEDRTTTPVTVIPLKTLDADVEDVSNQMPWTGKPVQLQRLLHRRQSFASAACQRKTRRGSSDFVQRRADRDARSFRAGRRKRPREH